MFIPKFKPNSRIPEIVEQYLWEELAKEKNKYKKRGNLNYLKVLRIQDGIRSLEKELETLRKGKMCFHNIKHYVRDAKKKGATPC